MIDKEARQVVVYQGKNLTVKATRHGKARKNATYATFRLSIGKPAYRERQNIKKITKFPLTEIRYTKKKKPQK